MLSGASGELKDFSGFREIGQHRAIRVIQCCSGDIGHHGATLNAKGIAHLKLGSMEQIIVSVNSRIKGYGKKGRLKCYSLSPH